MDLHDIAELFKPTRPALRLRQGTVDAINLDGTVDVTVAGATTVVTGVKCFDHVTPEEGHGIWLLTDGTDLIGIGTIGASP